jgi:membrane protein involved in colicin uptake
MAEIQYPRWRYKGDKSVLVNDAKEEKALGGGWFDNPEQANPSTQPPTPAEQIAAAKAAEDKAAADAKAKADADAKAKADAAKPGPVPVK